MDGFLAILSVSPLLLMNLNRPYYHVWVREKSKGLAKPCFPVLLTVCCLPSLFWPHSLSPSYPHSHRCSPPCVSVIPSWCVSYHMPLDPSSSCSAWHRIDKGQVSSPFLSVAVLYIMTIARKRLHGSGRKKLGMFVELGKPWAGETSPKLGRGFVSSVLSHSTHTTRSSYFPLRTDFYFKW